MGLTMMTWKGLDANAHENGYYTVKYVCHQHMIINIFVVNNIFIAKYFAGCMAKIFTYCQYVSVDMNKLAHFPCNQFRSDIQKTRLQDVDDYKQRQVCIQAAEEKYPRKKSDTMTAQLILGRFFLLLSTKKPHLFTSICTHH